MHRSNHIRNDYNGIWPKPCQNDDQGGQCCFPVHIPILCSRLCYHGYVQFQRCFLRSSSRFLDFQRKSLGKSAARLMNNWLLSITNNVIENKFDRRTSLSPGSEPKLCLLTLHFRSVVETRRLVKTTVLDFVIISSSYSHQTPVWKNTQLRCQLKSCWQGIVTISS